MSTWQRNRGGCIGATHYNALQHTATHRNTLQQTVAHCGTLWHSAAHCGTLQHTTTHYNALQHTATHCITLQHTTTHCNIAHLAQSTATHCNVAERSKSPHLFIKIAFVEFVETACVGTHRVYLAERSMRPLASAVRPIEPKASIIAAYTCVERFVSGRLRSKRHA